MRVLISLVSALAVLGTLYHGAFEQENVSSLSLTRNEAALLEYRSWKQMYKSDSNDIEEIDFYRFYVWCENYKLVMKHAEEKHSFTIGMNKFADLTNEEFRSQYFGEKLFATQQKVQSVPMNTDTSINVNWVNKGVTGNVLNQGQCGSCWAFSAVENIQSVNAMNGNEFTYYSEQELVDCSSTKGGNQGCNGGEMFLAFEYVIKNGIVTSAQYPYRARDQTCKTNSSWVPAFPITSYTNVTAGNCEVLATAIQQQPVSIAIDAGGIWFQLYTGGVFDKCGTQLDHGVLLVGLVNNNGTGYWLVQNSWGTGWGQNGYIELALGDTCGLCDAASYANLKQ